MCRLGTLCPAQDGSDTLFPQQDQHSSLQLGGNLQKCSHLGQYLNHASHALWEKVAKIHGLSELLWDLSGTYYVKEYILVGSCS